MINQNKYVDYIEDKDDFRPVMGSTFIYAFTLEERSKLAADFISKWGDMILFVGISYQDSDSITIEGKNAEYQLRSKDSMRDFVENFTTGFVYFDISGLNARISAALLPYLFEAEKEVRIVYAEPSTYDLDKFRKEGVLVDLAEKVEGIKPLPGFASIMMGNQPMKFIPLLGFEGARFTQMLEDVAPPDDDIIPVVGLPGYRMEYPFVTLFSNKAPLMSTSSWENIIYVGANSVVEVYLKLKDLSQQYNNVKLVVAPIGTKPHAIGAILFAYKHREQVELVYDNPKRNEQRTDGIGKIVICNATRLINEN